MSYLTVALKLVASSVTDETQTSHVIFCCKLQSDIHTCSSTTGKGEGRGGVPLYIVQHVYELSR